MSEEHEPIDIEKYILPAGKWRIHFYSETENPTWHRKVFILEEPTPIKNLMIDGYKIGSCWQMS